MAPYFIRNLVPRRERRTEGRPLLEALSSITLVQWGLFWSGYVPHFSSPFLAGTCNLRAHRPEGTPNGIKDRLAMLGREAGRLPSQSGRHGKKYVVQTLQSAYVNRAERRGRGWVW